MTEHTLKGKNVLIAGGGKNLGGLVARQSAAAGANVAIHYNSDASRPDAEDTLAAVQAEGVQGAIFQGDLTSPQNVATLFDEAEKT
ncbi:MAG: SDR family NAD(P)-dependent oxidoreductase, partial [Kocuria sp.]|nr:SDR family NAD(P)-dependent oxidoreductase [Kocuria sp.]